MQLVKLTRTQVKRVYLRFLRKDFPDNERKSLGMILRSLDAGTYRCFGGFEEGKLVAYAFLVKHGERYLLDYLAAIPAKRGQGVGSALLRLLKEQLAGAQSVVAEVEDPAQAETAAEKELRERRLRFYLRNGFADPDVRFVTFGVPYQVIELVLDAPHSPEEVRELYRAHYRAMLPEAVCKRFIR